MNKVPPANAFDDILSSQGFSSSAKQANRSLADLKREEDSKTMDPITIKVGIYSSVKRFYRRPFVLIRHFQIFG